jgi:hypothetical protein
VAALAKINSGLFDENASTAALDHDTDLETGIEMVKTCVDEAPAKYYGYVDEAPAKN